jgi:AcrR family transcriptional regulator
MSNGQNGKDPVREEILNEARELFERFGFKKTSMEDIARQIGKSKSALYYYYKTKEDIIEAVILREIEVVEIMVAEAMSIEESAVAKFRVFFTTVLGRMKEKANKFSTFKVDFYDNHSLLDNIVTKRDSNMEDLLKDIVIYGISRQEVKMMNNAEINLWAKMVNITIKGFADKFFLENSDYLSEQQIAFLADKLFNGIIR